MAETKKYLDKAGVEQLWDAIVKRDNGIKLSYEDGNIKLTGLNGENLGSIDAAPFVKDGMLQDVSIVVSSLELPITYDDTEYTDGTKFIKFAWNTDGADKVDFIKLDEIGAVYTGTESIDISAANKISVKKVGADKTATSADIPVAGGPLAALLNEAGIESISKDTNIQEVLMKLFCKELFADVFTTDASLVSSVAAPTINMSTSTVEVGTPVHYSVTNGASSYVATPHKATGLVYGYSATDNDKKEHTETEISATFGPVTLLSDTSSLTISGATSGVQEGTSAAESATLEGDITAVEGLNTLNASNTSATYQGTCGQLNKVYACSNLGNTDESHVSELKAEKPLKSLSVTASASARSFTGKYKYFIGAFDTVYSETEYNSEYIRATKVKSSNFMNGTTVDITVDVPAGTKGMYIAIPEGVDDLGANLHVIQTTALNNDASKDIAKNVRDVVMTCGGVHTCNYKVFTWDFPGATEGVETFHITKF